MTLQKKLARKLMSKQNRGFGLMLILLSLASLATMTACTQQRQAPSSVGLEAENNTTQQKNSNYSYPHPSTWKSGHVEYYVKFGSGLQGTDKDCARCHNDKSQNLGTPKNLSCAIQCHTVAKSPEGNTPLPSKPMGGGSPCFECHKSNFSRMKAHYPASAGLCESCHTADSVHFADKTKKTAKTNKSNQSCLNCHGKMDTHNQIHKALTMNDQSCIYCHDAHGSEHAFFTRDSLPNLCLDCHTDVVDDAAKSTHGIITGTADNKRSCANCHNPHSADFKPLLMQDKKTLCLSCHDREFKSHFADGSERVIPNIKAKIKGPNPHPITATNEGNCAMCHSPHASQHSALLTKKYPVTPYEKYTPKVDKTPNSYELCFTCHEEAMLSKVATVDDTEFRNDVKGADGQIERTNLHWLHVVNGGASGDLERGRSCFVCHDPHGSEQKHMVKTSFRMNSSTTVKVNYKATAIGGECAFTCHGDPVKKYSRIIE